MDTLDLFATVFGMRLEDDLPNSAFLILPGLQEFRLSRATWKICADRRIWVAGTADDPSYDIRQLETLLHIEPVDEVDLSFQGYAANTREQMEWAVGKLICDSSVKNLYVSTAAYHLPRCVLTLVKAWKLRGDGRGLRVGTSPTIDFDPAVGFSANPYKKSSSVSNEIDRIRRYQSSGDVASLDDLRRFIIQADRGEKAAVHSELFHKSR